uniref:Uncharacterized protein n=1 Tax=uncultured marine bacterium 577 TaxID=257398 RepID=Q6SFY3_9BACT|nr:hypothetical protein MBMO_EBAC080-L12H07.28 [uncultured marine bacterium 577]
MIKEIRHNILNFITCNQFYKDKVTIKTKKFFIQLILQQ